MNAWQCRSARDFLKLSRAELAELTGLGTQTITNVEIGQKVRASTLDKIEAYFTSQGITLMTKKGSRLVEVPDETA